MRNWGFKGALEKPSLLLQGIFYKEVSGVNEPTKKAVRLIYHFKKVERLNRCHAGAEWIPLCPWIDMILQHGWLFLLIPVRCKTYFSSLKWSTKNFKSINNSRVFLAAIKFSQKQRREKDMAEEAFEKKQSSRFQTSFVRISIHQMWYLEKNCVYIWKR